MIFYSIRSAATETGISQDFLRKGCRNGTIPHIKCGAKYLVNVPLLLEQINNGQEKSEDAD